MNENSPTTQATLELEPAPEINQTINLDLPAVATALSRRLYAAGVPVTPERAVNFVAALNLVGPVSRRHVYCTARAVFVSAHAHLAAFDRVFASVFDRYPDAHDELAAAGAAAEDRRHAGQA